MLHRTLIQAAVILAACLPACSPCRAAGLNVQIFPLTGEVRLQNTGAAAVPFVYYSIASPSAALKSSTVFWKSISDNYDVSGNGFIDPAFNWTKISATSSQLTEGAFSGPGGSLAPLRSVSLGQIWNPVLYPSNDLTFTVLQADSSPVAITTQYAVVGDYNSDGMVNSLDYSVWRQTFGSITSLNADGNLNGVVDDADYVVWRSNFGLTLPGAGSAAGGGASLSLNAVPEPAAVILLLTAGCAVLTARVRAQGAGRCGRHRTSRRQ
jgi:hypothetical protein